MKTVNRNKEADRDGYYSDQESGSPGCIKRSYSTDFGRVWRRNHNIYRFYLIFNYLLVFFTFLLVIIVGFFITPGFGSSFAKSNMVLAVIKRMPRIIFIEYILPCFIYLFEGFPEISPGLIICNFDGTDLIRFDYHSGKYI
jgi:hypothetical protein